MSDEYHVHVWVERGQSAAVEAESPEEAEEIGVERIKDDLRELGIPLDEFQIVVDEVVQ